MNKAETSKLSVSLHKNLVYIQELFHLSSDLKVRSFKIKDNIVRDGAILYFDAITDTKNIQEHLLTPLLKVGKIDNIEDVISCHLSLMDVSSVTSYDEISTGLSEGKTIVIIEGFDQAILANSTDWQMRAVTEPDTQRSAKGSMIGFNEQLNVNINLLRNMIQMPNLKVETRKVGSKSKTDVAIIYIDEFVDQSILEETRRIISEIDVTYLLEARVIEDAIEKKPKLFPLVFTCERADVSVSALFEGRVVILINGVPYALIVPTLFLHYFHQPDEYNTKSGRFSKRLLRFVCWFVSIFSLGFYITLVRFHPHWIRHPFDDKLLTQSDTLFPILLEIMFLLFLFELLTEASLRIPKATIILLSLIGAIVVGQTSVETKLIHPLTLVVVGINYLTSINIASGGLFGAMRTLRIFFLLLGYFFGVTGMIIGFIIVTVYMASLKSLGVPYLAPFFPFRFKEMKDSLYRGNLQNLINSKHTYPHKVKE
ncbi:spore germination protein [Gottfriedia sp. NPDC057991]|uniref:spore germination protein n=1 Tax=Gottfriedia sp. NPDC057991 TaxID=3346298 RepID=UPI0036D8239B